MGLFSSKKKTVVGTSVMRLVDEDNVPDTILSALIDHSLNGNPRASMYSSLEKEVLNGPHHKFERMYRYAASGDYYFGLPNAQVLSSDAGTGAAQAAIEAEVGMSVTIDYLHFRPPNNVHLGWQELVDHYEYNPRTNEIAGLSTQHGFPVYLDDLVAIHEGAIEENTAYGVLGESPQAGYTPERPARASQTELGHLVKDQNWVMGADQEGVEIHYIWEDEAGEIHKRFLLVSLTAYDSDLEYYQARYWYNSGDGDVVKYWTYLPGTGTHPAVDTALDANYINPGTYFPFVMFRHHRENRTADHLINTPEFITTSKLLKNLGMDFKEMGDNIHENPDIDDVDQAVMYMGVPITSQDAVEMEYLFRFFSNLHTITPPRRKGQPSMSQGIDIDWALSISDADFRVLISYRSVDKVTRAGKLGPIGTCTNTSEVTYIPVPGNNSLNAPGKPVNSRIFRRQITDSFYDEIVVATPKMRYLIYRDRGVTSDENDERFLVPIDRSLAKQMNPLKREKLYFRSLHLVVNSRVTHTVSWYKQRWFGYVLLVVAVVLTILDFGADGGTFIQGALAFIAGLTLKKIALMIFWYLVIQQVAVLVVQELGVEAAFLIAIVMAVWGYGLTSQSGGVGNSVWAENLLKVSSGLTNAADNQMKVLMAEYISEAEEFNLMAEERWAELEEVNELLGGRRLLDPFAFVGLEPFNVWGETPDNYYDRTVHAGNVGAMSYEIVESFVELSLKLPDMNSTVGETMYA